MVVAYIVSVAPLGNERVSLKGSHTRISLDIDIRSIINKRSSCIAIRNGYLLATCGRCGIMKITANDVTQSSGSIIQDRLLSNVAIKIGASLDEDIAKIQEDIRFIFAFLQP